MSEDNEEIIIIKKILYDFTIGNLNNLTLYFTLKDFFTK